MCVYVCVHASSCFVGVERTAAPTSTPTFPASHAMNIGRSPPPDPPRPPLRFSPPSVPPPPLLFSPPFFAPPPLVPPQPPLCGSSPVVLAGRGVVHRVWISSVEG